MTEYIGTGSKADGSPATLRLADVGRDDGYVAATLLRHAEREHVVLAAMTTPDGTSYQLTPEMSGQLDTSYTLALGYGWGRADADARNVDAFAFAEAFCGRKFQYLTEATHFMPPVRDAYEQWRATGHIDTKGTPA